MSKIAVEQISKYHPDKYADAISDAILKAILEKDPEAQCGIETMVKDKKVVLGGEITCNIGKEHYDYLIETAVHTVANSLLYKVNKIINLIGKQSPQINHAVLGGDEIGAGDQGIVVGYANRLELNPLGSRNPYLAKLVADDIINAIEQHIEENGQEYFMGDAKTQVIYDNETESINEIIISVCHPETSIEIFPPLDLVKGYLKHTVIPDVLRKWGFEFKEIYDIKKTINPSGVWTIGGPTADAGCCGRKLVCDAYGPQVPIGGGNSWGKSLTKVDRSGAIVARYIALDILKKWPELESAKVEISYVIGVAQPSSVDFELVPDPYLGFDLRVWDEIAQYIDNTYDLTPSGLIKFIKDNNIDIYQRIGQMK